MSVTGDDVVTQRISLGGLFPSASRQAVLLLEGEAAESARRMRVSVGEVVDLENGCVRPEVNTADTTCGDGPGQGELSQYITVGLQAGRESSDGSRSCEVSGPIQFRTLTALSIDSVDLGLVDDGGVMCVVATFEHVVADDDNLTQSDSTGFALLLAMDTRPVDPDVQGEQAVASNTATDNTGVGVVSDVVTPTSVNAGLLDLGTVDEGIPMAMVMIAAGAGLLLLAVVVLVRERQRLVGAAVSDG